MSTTGAQVLSERLVGDRMILAKRFALVVLGVFALALAAKVQVPLWPSPVPVTLGTFAVLSIGAAYGPRLGMVTILTYMLIGALGYDVFATSDPSNPDKIGIAYMLGGSGGYLLGYVLATFALGAAARMAWDRNLATMAVAMLVGNALIYVPGLLWLRQWIDTNGLYNAETFASLNAQTMAWGLTPFLFGDGLKLALAALLFPVLWKMVGQARR